MRETRMIHQLRIYEIFEQNKAAFHERFHRHALRIWQPYGFELVAAWEKFRADEEWIEVKRVMSAQRSTVSRWGRSKRGC